MLQMASHEQDAASKATRTEFEAEGPSDPLSDALAASSTETIMHAEPSENLQCGHWSGKVGAIAQNGEMFYFKPELFPFTRGLEISVMQFRDSTSPTAAHWSGNIKVTLLSDEAASGSLACDGCTAYAHRTSMVPQAGNWQVDDTFCLVMMEFIVKGTEPWKNNPEGKYFYFDKGAYDMPTCRFPSFQMRSDFSSSRRRSPAKTWADGLDLVYAGYSKFFEKDPATEGITCDGCTAFGRREPTSSAAANQWQTGDFVCVPDLEFTVVSAKSYKGKGAGYYFFLDLRGYSIINGRYPVFQFREIDGARVNTYYDYVKIFSGTGTTSCDKCDAHGRRDGGMAPGQFKEGDTIQLCSQFLEAAPQAE